VLRGYPVNGRSQFAVDSSTVGAGVSPRDVKLYALQLPRYLNGFACAVAHGNQGVVLQ
jgi:hypothetical protein